MTTTTTQDRVASAAGCDIHYLEMGQGPNLMFLHGSGGFRFDETAFGLLAKGYRLIVPSMPGFDQSTTGSAATGQDVADVMAAFVQSVAGGETNVVGESFGGRIAAWLTVRHPEVIGKAILAAPGGLRRSGGDRGLDLSPEEREIRLYGKVLNRDKTPEAQAQHRANVVNATRFGGPPWDEELFQQLPTVTRPVLVLYGSNDQTLKREDVSLFHERIPNSRMSVIEGAPHVLSASFPDEFVALLSGFLDEPAG